MYHFIGKPLHGPGPYEEEAFDPSGKVEPQIRRKLTLTCTEKS